MSKKFYFKVANVDEDGEKRDLGVHEARRLIGPKSYNKNWNLTNYTAELRNEKTDEFYAFVDFHGDEGAVRECSHCLTFEIHNRLAPKIKKKNEPIAPDDDQWLSCYECGNTFPAYQTFLESQIKDSLQTVSSPFESNELVFLSTDSRASTRRRRERRDGFRKGVHKYRSKRIDYGKEEDPDVHSELNRGANVKIL